MSKACQEKIQFIIVSLIIIAPGEDCSYLFVEDSSTMIYDTIIC